MMGIQFVKTPMDAAVLTSARVLKKRIFFYGISFRWLFAIGILVMKKDTKKS